MSESEERSGHHDLELEVDREGDTYVIRLSGELDLGNHERLDEALREAEASDATRIHLDLDRLVFIDSTGLRVILKAARRSEASGDRLRLTHGTGYVADMFRLTALDVTLPFED
jgi:anti-anti-sigma factor